MKLKSYLLLLIGLFAVFANAQPGGGVGINILQPDSSAILHLEANDRGLLLPRLTTAQMNAIPNPAEGLVIFNVEDSLVRYWNDGCWLKAHQRSCNDCEFVATLSSNSGVIDHVTTDSVSFTVDVVQTNGNADISVGYIFIPPTGMTIDIANPLIDSVGSATFSIAADIFTAPGTYPIVIQVSCQNEVFFLTYILELPPCLEVDIAANSANVDLQADYFLPGPSDPPVCIIAEVFSGVDITSANTANPALSWGNLHPQSHVGFINNGAVLGRGGDGSSLGNLLQLQFASPGGDAGNALEISTKTTFLNNGPIFGGGGGGGGIGTGLDLSTNLPFIGTVGVCAAAGSGGGGGSADGLGGGTAGACPGSGPLYFTFTFVEDGDNATSGASSVPGAGGVIAENIPINVGASGFNLNITPGINISGGNGGNFGQQGGPGTGSATIDVSLTVPIIGNIPLFNGSFTLISSAGGAAGLAIKTNNNQILNLPTPSNNVLGGIQP